MIQAPDKKGFVCKIVHRALNSLCAEARMKSSGKREVIKRRANEKRRQSQAESEEENENVGEEGED